MNSKIVIQYGNLYSDILNLTQKSCPQRFAIICLNFSIYSKTNPLKILFKRLSKKCSATSCFKSFSLQIVQSFVTLTEIIIFLLNVRSIVTLTKIVE